jgi:hypothetical protein
MPTGAVPLSGAGVISRRPSTNFLNLVPAAASTTLNPAAALTDKPSGPSVELSRLRTFRYFNSIGH